MNTPKLEDVHIEVVKNGWLVEVDRDDEQTDKHVFERQEDMISFIDGITGGMSSDMLVHSEV